KKADETSGFSCGHAGQPLRWADHEGLTFRTSVHKEDRSMLATPVRMAALAVVLSWCAAHGASAALVQLTITGRTGGGIFGLTEHDLTQTIVYDTDATPTLEFDGPGVIATYAAVSHILDIGGVVSDQ